MGVCVVDFTSEVFRLLGGNGVEGIEGGGLGLIGVDEPIGM
jgi:hypothetical protein